VNLPHVFAKVTASVPMPGGYQVQVMAGTHWLADDPVVTLRPDLFTADCRYGLAWSGDPPECLSIPPEDDDPALADDESGAAMTSRARSRSHAERSRR
jgi:hypothetical protein